MSGTMPSLEEGLLGGRPSCVSPVGALWALQRTHKTLKVEAEKETGEVVQAVSVQADSEGEGEALVTHKLITSASQTTHKRHTHNYSCTFHC